MDYSGLLFTGDPRLKAIPPDKRIKLATGVYTADTKTPPEAIVRREMLTILGHLFPGAVISHRSAQEMKPSDSGELFLTYRYKRRYLLPGLVVKLIRGVGFLEGDLSLPGGLYRSSEARMLLENLQPSRAREGGLKSLGQPMVERFLDRLCTQRGEDALNDIRDDAAEIAPKLGMEKEYNRLNRIISTLLKTRNEPLITTSGRARAMGEPFDPNRIGIFENLRDALVGAGANLYPGSPLTDNPTAFLNSAFFDAYFSNYIEGTTFTIEEATEIVFDGKIFYERHQDSHDILATFNLLSSRREMDQSYPDASSFISLLQNRHRIMLEGSTHADPGRIKEVRNYAGNTTFVEPELVIGTLKKGFEVLQSIGDPFARAAFIMFMVSEVHPFRDGNGRLARLMMNAELYRHGVDRIIIPTGYREDYLGAVRRLTRDADPSPYITMLGYAARFTGQVDFSTMESAIMDLARAEAFSEGRDSRLVFKFLF